MIKRQIKKPLLYAIYGLSILSIIGSVYLLETSKIEEPLTPTEEPINIENPVVDQELPVVSTPTKTTITRPYIREDIKIVKEYYDYQDESDKQQNSLIYYDNTYMQNSGVCYGNNDQFDVVSIFNGTVISVKQDDLLGGIVEIRHTNDIISVYQSLNEITVKENDSITQGQVIGKSGESNIAKELNNHLHFELIIRGEVVNPENYYDKNINEI